MIKRFTDMSILVRIALLALVPAMALLGVGLVQVVDRRAVAKDAGRVAEVVASAPVISHLVHELQKERGTSAGFVASKGKSFADTIGDRRAETDAAFAAFEKLMPGVDADLALPAFSKSYADAAAALARLQETRAGVDGLTLGVPDVASYYTPLIAELLAMVESVTLTSDDGRIVRAMTAYTAFLQGKERAGIERAMGAGGFGAGKFAPQIYRNFVRLGAMQDAYAGMFRRFATDGEVAALDEALAGPVQGDVDRMRALAYEAPFGGDITSVGGPAWFDASTRRIDAMKTVEDRIAADIVELAGDIAKSANSSVMVLVAFLAALLAAVGAVSVFVARSLANPLHRLARDMSRLARDDTSIEIVDRNRGDEIGEMAMAVEALRKFALERKELERVAGAERASNEANRADARVQNLRRYAEMLESINRSTIDLARLAKNADEASANSQTISAAAEELVASVEAITASSGETAAEAESADLAASEGREAVEGVTETISAITDAVAGTSASMSVLTEASQQIGAILESIQGISNQTNLLALNATIEAARAGEAGKGFAVVASEVKSLASQTSVLTEEIAKRIEALQKGIAMIGDTMQRSRSAVAAGENAVGVAGNTMFSVTERVTRVSANMQEISAILGQQMTASGEIAASISSVTDLAVSNARIVRTITGDIQESNKRISDIATRAFEATSPRELCEMAKIDHIMFKKRVVDALLGGAEWNVKDVPDHHHCRLGKWFDGVKDPAISSQPAYAALKHPHAVVHSAAREALAAGAEGRIEEALSAAERMNEASAEVLRHLNALSDALAGISPAKAA